MPHYTISFEGATMTAFGHRKLLPQILQAVCNSALKGDREAIELIFEQGARLSFYCAMLAHNSRLHDP
jgi:hypothetical protein